MELFFPSWKCDYWKFLWNCQCYVNHEERPCWMWCSFQVKKDRFECIYQIYICSSSPWIIYACGKISCIYVYSWNVMWGLAWSRKLSVKCYFCDWTHVCSIILPWTISWYFMSWNNVGFAKRPQNRSFSHTNDLQHLKHLFYGRISNFMYFRLWITMLDFESFRYRGLKI